MYNQLPILLVYVSILNDFVYQCVFSRPY